MIKIIIINSIRLLIKLLMHTVLLKDDNNVIVFGRNFSGQLGSGHNSYQNKPQTLMQWTAIRQIAGKF